MTLFEKYPALDAAWQFVKSQDDTTLIIAGSFVFVIIVAIIARSRQPVYGYEAEKPLMKANTTFLKLYPLCVFACWIAILAGLGLVALGGAAHLGHIDLGQEFGFMPPLELALYACAIPFGASMGLWKLSFQRKRALAHIAAHQEAVRKAGPIRSY